jgi:leucyl aminopeptidase
MPAHVCNWSVMGSEQQLLLNANEQDCTAIFHYKDDLMDEALNADDHHTKLNHVLKNGWFAGDCGETFILYSSDDSFSPLAPLVFVGLGPRGGKDAFRIAAASLGRMVKDKKFKSIALLHDIHSTDQSKLHQDLHDIIEGFQLGIYQRQSYKLSDQTSEQIELNITIFSDQWAGSDYADATISRAKIFADATNYARDLTNEPGNLLTPELLASEASRMASLVSPLVCEILNEADIQSIGMGGLLAVGQGSAHPPRLIAIKYQGGSQWSDVLGLVGKGITFDTGGISIKKAEGMEEMISDMGGAAVILAVMQAVAQLKLPINILAVVPVAENMPSGSAYRPGDIITMMGGRTVEVLNTDAEGRIVLADAVTYACQQGVTRIIDVATLTGAVLVALGDIATAAITNDEAFLKPLLQASDRSGEKLWQLPVYPEYREMVKSKVADVKNSAGKWAGAITGGLFIGEFTDGRPWIHLDIGGTAWLWRERGVDPEGGTGAMVRTILHYLTNK